MYFFYSSFLVIFLVFYVSDWAVCTCVYLFGSVLRISSFIIDI